MINMNFSFLVTPEINPRHWRQGNNCIINVLICFFACFGILTPIAVPVILSDSQSGSWKINKIGHFLVGGKKLCTMASATEAKGAVAIAGSSFVAALRPRIILFGDSLTERSFDAPEGWGASLASFYVRRADITNRGMSGYNTRWALQTLPYVFGRERTPGVPLVQATAERVLFATVFFGANDAARIDGTSHSARQHVPLDEYRGNLKEMVRYIKATGVERVAIITPPPVSDTGRKIAQIQRMGEQARNWPLDRNFATSAEYSKAAVDVAKELGVPCLDLFTLLQDENWEQKYLCDGLHLTPLGQEKVFHLMRKLVQDEWHDILPHLLPTQFPAWDAINFDDIPSSFVATEAAFQQQPP
ncbi:hypothetical protein VaNZ11_008740 [Volvox africanus]|uniref:SGNH hydrolase-type esterase domain-containing protein n=1 Tax=Volvox africanus TaxID=51714 RepID=A0ABQ5S5S4_9CHLO|nr:hypothetical protein VaNZ11_008740 [Volvox africanus]